MHDSQISDVTLQMPSSGTKKREQITGSMRFHPNLLYPKTKTIGKCPMQIGQHILQMLQPNEHLHQLKAVRPQEQSAISGHDAATLGFRVFFSFEGPGLVRLLLRSALMDAITASAPGPRPFLPTNFTPSFSQR